jgi:hypothetical protein
MGILSALFMEFAESSNVSKLEGLKLNEEKMICHIMHSKNHSKLAKEYFIHGYFRVKTLVTSKSVAYRESEVKLKACKTIINRW